MQRVFQIKKESMKLCSEMQGMKLKLNLILPKLLGLGHIITWFTVKLHVTVAVSLVPGTQEVTALLGLRKSSRGLPGAHCPQPHTHTQRHALTFAQVSSKAHPLQSIWCLIKRSKQYDLKPNQIPNNLFLSKAFILSE